MRNPCNMWYLAVFLVNLVVGEYDYRYYSDNYGQGDYLSDWTQDWATMSGRIQRPKCIDIPTNLTLCQNIGYSRMRLPNLLDHDTLNEVTHQARSWVPLLGIHCHPDTKLFLCSLFSPVCLDRPIYPCRSLCESVKQACFGRMEPYGFPWPDMLKCDKFPVDNDLCIEQQNHIKPDNNCTACKHPLTYEALVDNFCRADYVARVKVNELRDLLSGHKGFLIKKKKKFYKKKGLSKKDRKKMLPMIENGKKCSCDSVNSTEAKYLIMGNKVNDELFVSFVTPWQRKNKTFKRAIRAMKKGNLCEGIFQELTAGEIVNNKSKDTNSKGGRKDKGNNKKGKRKKNRKRNKGKGNKGGKGKNRKGDRNKKRRPNRNQKNEATNLSASKGGN